MGSPTTPPPHQIQEVVPGVHRAILDWPSTEIIPTLLDERHPFVLSWGGHLGDHRWQEFQLPIASPQQPEAVLARRVEVDFVVATSRYLELLPRLGPKQRGVQLLHPPQDHLDLRRIRGPERWRLLEEIGWHVWFDIPGNDFGEVASPDRAVVEAAVAWVVEQD